MALIRAQGFSKIIDVYSGVTAPYKTAQTHGITDAEAQALGFQSGQKFLDAMWKAVDDHAVAANWVPVAYHIFDEPTEAKMPPILEGVKMHIEAAKGLQRTTFTGATSMKGNDPKNPHYDLMRAIMMPQLNNHDEASVAAIQEAGRPFSFYNSDNRWTIGRYMRMLVVKHQMALRLNWHFNIVAGDPYYALDCREDDYCWYNTDENQTMIPAVAYLAEDLAGLNDYRALATLTRLVKEKAGTPAAAQGQKILDSVNALEAGKDREAAAAKDPAAFYGPQREEVINAIIDLLK